MIAREGETAAGACCAIWRRLRPTWGRGADGVSRAARDDRSGAAVPGILRLSFSAKVPKGVPMRRSFEAPGARVEPRPDGAALTLPRDAEVGSVIEVKGSLHLGKPDAEAVVTSSHRIAVIAPLELSLENHGFDPEAGAARLRATTATGFRARGPAGGASASGWKVTGDGLFRFLLRRAVSQLDPGGRPPPVPWR